jgi:hypothetical protein
MVDGRNFDGSKRDIKHNTIDSKNTSTLKLQDNSTVHQAKDSNVLVYFVHSSV